MNRRQHRQEDVTSDLAADAWFLADMADRISMDWFCSSDRASADSGGDRVNTADLAVESALRDELRHRRPCDSIVGEELGAHEAGEIEWIIDPIDGTAAFRAGRPEWATLIAALTAGVVQAAVCSAPALGLRWHARRGAGATLTRLDDHLHRRIAAAAPCSLADARIGYWIGPGAADSDAARSVGALMRTCLPINPPDTRPSWGRGHPNGSLLVADGVLDAFILVGGAAWDHAAPSLIVEEAGARWHVFEHDGVSTLIVATAGLDQTIIGRLRSPRG